MNRFFRVFVCILFSVAIFSQNVYAASNPSIPVLVTGYCVHSGGIIDPVVTIAPSTASTVTGDIATYNRTLSYHFVDNLHFVFNNKKADGTSGSYVSGGYYSIKNAITFDYTVKYTPATVTSLTPSITMHLGDVPDGMILTIGSAGTPTTSGSVNFKVYMSGVVNLSYIRTASIPVFIDLTFNDVYGLASAKTFPSVVFTTSLTPKPASGSVSLVTNFSSTDDILSDTNQTIKDQHQEELDKANETSGNITSSSSQLQGTLSAWEIFTMPFQLVKDFVQAISSDGNTGFTFPSFSMMGYEIWPSYTFDLGTVKSNFPVLYNGLHLVSGTIVVSGFIHYCWRKWSILMGDDMPESSGSEGGN